MLAPPALLATGPRVASAATSSRVVVVLPLVPETQATTRSAASSTSSPGCSSSVIRPPITSPEPRRSSREDWDAAVPASTARLLRTPIATALTLVSGQLAAAGPSRLQGLQDGRAHAVALQLADGADRRTARRGDRLPQLRRVHAGVARHHRRADRGLHDHRGRGRLGGDAARLRRAPGAA